MRQVGAHEAELAPEPQQPASSITKVGVSHIQLGSPIGSGTYGYVSVVCVKKEWKRKEHLSEIALSLSTSSPLNIYKLKGNQIDLLPIFLPFPHPPTQP